MEDISTIFLLLIMSATMSYVVGLQATGFLNVGFRGSVGSFPNVSQTVSQEAAAVAHPLQSAVVGDISKQCWYCISKQCTLLKETLKMTYKQIKNTKEPDLNKLTLEFRNRVFNLLSAGTDISNSEEFHPDEMFTVFIYGFSDDPTKDSFQVINDAFKKIGNFNVINLDGNSLRKWLYIRSTTYTRFIGEKLGKVLASLKKAGLKSKNIHVIGYGLGAHVAGFTGKSYFNLTEEHIGQITGLDPAGPCFAELDPKMRLTSSDASFVDVIHTDAGVFGLEDPMGHADFYPNGGNKQPGCLTLSCSHKRSLNFYAESVVNPYIFIFKKCKDWDTFKNGTCGNNYYSFMGYQVPKTTRGRYYLQTADKYPYGL